MGFIFGFDDKLPTFNIYNYLLNILKFIIFSFLALLIHNTIQKYFANRAGASTELSLWTSKYKLKFFRLKIPLFSFPKGIIFPILISFISLGQVFFAATTTTNISVKPAYRLGRKFVKLTEFEQAKIAAVSPLFHIVLAIILSIFNIKILDEFALINTMMAISTMLPLPGLLGATVLFNSKPLYVFSAVFILISALLLKLLSNISTLFIAFLLAALVLFAYLWRFYTKK